MRVRVLHFGMLREARGATEEEVDLDGPTTARALYAQLFPGPLQDLPIAYARNEVYVSADTMLADGDELVFVPPVGGG